MNAHMVDENGLPYLDKSYQSKTSVTTIDGDNVPHTDLTVYTDPRVDVSAGRFNVPIWIGIYQLLSMAGFVIWRMAVRS